MKITSVEAQYEIPGFEIAPRAFEADEADDDFADAPYSFDGKVPEAPSPAGWQKLLGLDAIAPSAISIDPPTRWMSVAGKSRAAASYRLTAEAGSPAGAAGSPSQSVHNMLAAVAQTRQRVAQIRARARAGA